MSPEIPPRSPNAKSLSRSALVLFVAILAAWLCTLVGFAVTLLVSELLYRLIEKPSLRLSQALKPYFA